MVGKSLYILFLYFDGVVICPPTKKKKQKFVCFHSNKNALNAGHCRLVGWPIYHSRVILLFNLLDLDDGINSRKPVSGLKACRISWGNMKLSENKPPRVQNLPTWRSTMMWTGASSETWFLRQNETWEKFGGHWWIYINFGTSESGARAAVNEYADELIQLCVRSGFCDLLAAVKSANLYLWKSPVLVFLESQSIDLCQSAHAPFFPSPNAQFSTSNNE